MLRFPVKCARLRPAACRPDPSQTGWTSRPPPFLQQFFLFCHISELALRVPLVFTKKHGIYAARLMLRLRLAFANRTYYTMMPRSGPNKTAFTAVLHGSMFSKPMCGSASAHKVRAAAQAAALRLLYHISIPPPNGGKARHRARPMHRTQDTPARRAKKGSTCKMRRKSCQPFTAPAVIPLMI